MTRRLWILFALASAIPLCAATLEQLSLDEMIGKSTAIVRGVVTGSYTARSGSVIYTHYSVRVVEGLKGGAATSVDVAVPGGTLNGLQQNFSGAPEFTAGANYVFFLWTGKSGLTQVMGLTQGIFSLGKDGSSDPVVTRAASHEVMVASRTGRAVKDETLVMRMSELRARIAGATGTGRAAK